MFETKPRGGALASRLTPGRESGMELIGVVFAVVISVLLGATVLAFATGSVKEGVADTNDGAAGLFSQMDGVIADPLVGGGTGVGGAGSGQETIYFAVKDDTVFEAKAGMTWREWIGSEYDHTNGWWYIDFPHGHDWVEYGSKPIYTEDYKTVFADDTIRAGCVYISL